MLLKLLCRLLDGAKHSAKLQISANIAHILLHLPEQGLRAPKIIAHGLSAHAHILSDLAQRKILIVTHIKALTLFLRQHTAVVVKQQAHFQSVHRDPPCVKALPLTPEGL